AQHLAGVELDPNLAHRVLKGVVAPAAPVHARGRLWRAGTWPIRSARMALPSGTANSSTTANGVLDLRRVTIRHCAASSLDPQA
ncbi:MAG: hypothetical protein WA709_39090, partial [Stellaceae bacterium]